MLGKAWANCESNHSLLRSGELGKVLWNGRSGHEVVSENGAGKHRAKQLLKLLLPSPLPPFLLLLPMGIHLSKRQENNCQQLFLEDNFNLFFYSGTLPGQLLWSQNAFEQTNLQNASSGILLSVLTADGLVQWSCLCSSAE